MPKTIRRKVIASAASQLWVPEVIGKAWLLERLELLCDHIRHESPTSFSEKYRYLSSAVTPLPGPMSFKINPFMVEICNNFDSRSPIREVNVKKGVQVTFTTALETILFYVAFFRKIVSAMYVTADNELANMRVENNFIPMIQDSVFKYKIQSKDITSTRKTGKTKNQIQWQGGGYLVPTGAKNPNKARQISILQMLMDEIDGWPDTIGKDGDPVQLFTDRVSSFWQSGGKILRGSTPLIKGTSKIDKEYLRGDQRQFLVCCRHCNFPQALRWEGKNKEKNTRYGFNWDLDDGQLVLDSVRYECRECGHAHYEYDKEALLDLDEGARWEPTARAVDPLVRSYHLPAFYSPVGLQPWSKNVSLYLEAFDPVERRVKDANKMQIFYNNVLAETWEVIGDKIRFRFVSGHRRAVYRLGEIPNKWATEYAGGPVLLLTCTVDVHKDFLAVAVWGWTREMRSFLIEYKHFEAENCDDESSPVWELLRQVIEEYEYTADDGKEYRIAMTLVDAGYANATVTSFCAQWATGVFPILGRDRTARMQKISEFMPFTTQAGYQGFKILVDHYKDRMAPVLRRSWLEEMGEQPPYHFNAPVDLSDAALKELTKESKREKIDDRGNHMTYWYRPGNARNELWDLLIYGHASVEIIAWSVCTQQFGLETVDWQDFWNYLSEGAFFT